MKIRPVLVLFLFLAFLIYAIVNGLGVNNQKILEVAVEEREININNQVLLAKQVDSIRKKHMNFVLRYLSELAVMEKILNNALLEFMRKNGIDLDPEYKFSINQSRMVESYVKKRLELIFINILVFENNNKAFLADNDYYLSLTPEILGNMEKQEFRETVRRMREKNRLLEELRIRNNQMIGNLETGLSGAQFF